MKRLLARLELIEATEVLEVDVGWVTGKCNVLESGCGRLVRRNPRLRYERPAS